MLPISLFCVTIPGLKCFAYTPFDLCNLNQVLSQRSNGVNCRNNELEEVGSGDENEEIAPEEEFVPLDNKIVEVRSKSCHLWSDGDWDTILLLY